MIRILDTEYPISQDKVFYSFVFYIKFIMVCVYMFLLLQQFSEEYIFNVSGAWYTTTTKWILYMKAVSKQIN